MIKFLAIAAKHGRTAEYPPPLAAGFFKKYFLHAYLAFAVMAAFPGFSSAWFDETHLAIAKAAGYPKWYNAAGADIAKIKAGDVESHNHRVNNPPGTLITPEMIMGQIKKYNQINRKGQLYGAIIQSTRDYIRVKAKGKYGEYHMAYCAHYVGDLTMPLHNIVMNDFNKKHHLTIDGIIDNGILNNYKKIQIYSIRIRSEADLVKEVARIANLSMKLGYELSAKERLLTRAEAYQQVGHSASLLKAILEYAGRQGTTTEETP
ncbi:MAG: hypothetical protein Q8P24_15475 [Desulfobacterales bacterium]|nr:hypothetical protein [Desulfobacterales bacterium]